jgi:uncharacterized membrane protein
VADETSKPRRRPLFAVCSVAIPGFLILLGLGSAVSELFAGILLWTALFCAWLLPGAGLVCAVIAIVRKERWPVLAGIGFLINIGLLVLFISTPVQFGC